MKKKSQASTARRAMEREFRLLEKTLRGSLRQHAKMEALKISKFRKSESFYYLKICLIKVSRIS